MSAVKDGCRRSFQAQPQRLMAAMYSCNILANAEVLGKCEFIVNFIYVLYNLELKGYDGAYLFNNLYDYNG